jgi:hypothetical protein
MLFQVVHQHNSRACDRPCESGAHVCPAHDARWQQSSDMPSRNRTLAGTRGLLFTSRLLVFGDATRNNGQVRPTSRSVATRSPLAHSQASRQASAPIAMARCGCVSVLLYRHHAWPCEKLCELRTHATCLFLALLRAGLRCSLRRADARVQRCECHSHPFAFSPVRLTLVRIVLCCTCVLMFILSGPCDVGVATHPHNLSDCVA